MPKAEAMKPAVTQGRADVCFLSDANYAAPTAVVAKMVADRHEPEIASIYFVWLESASPPGELERFLAACGVELVCIRTSLMDPYRHFSAGRVPSATLARLLLPKILGDRIAGRFIYLDGDVDILHPIGELASIDVPAGSIAVADGYQDVITTQDPEKRKAWKRHVSGIGLGPSDKYFNNGVIATDMESWTAIAGDALAYFGKNTAACKFLDQDALNAVGKNRRVVLSPRYNFQRAYFGLGVERQLDPVILHFHGPWKPWQPTPFLRTWHSRARFLSSFAEMPELWQKAPPINLGAWRKPSHHIDAAVSTLKARRAARVQRREFEQYLASTTFVDGDVGGYTLIPGRRHGH